MSKQIKSWFFIVVFSIVCIPIHGMDESKNIENGENEKSISSDGIEECIFEKNGIPENLKHVLVFGPRYSGKSSIINLLLKKNSWKKPKVSESPTSFQTHDDPYWDSEYCFWETTDYCHRTTNELENLKRLSKNAHGFHACIFVCNYKNIDPWFHTTFYTSFLNQQVPLLFCITGKCLMFDIEDDYFVSWLKNYEKENICFSTNKNLVVFSNPLTQIKDSRKIEHEKANNKSKKDILEWLGSATNREACLTFVGHLPEIN